MIESERAELRLVKQMFGDGALLIERGPTGILPGSAVIDVDGRRLGSGPTFREALTAACRNIREGIGEKIGS